MRALLASLAALLVPVGAASALTTEPGFSATQVFTGLDQPTAISFAPDGKVLVAQKDGIIKVFPVVPALGTAPTTAASVPTFADLRGDVHNVWDKGLLGLAVNPGWPADKSVYALHTSDKIFGGLGQYNDTCPDGEGGLAEGCAVTSRLVRLTANAALTQATGPQAELINDWCMQFPSHSIGTLAFGPDAMLYASGGDGASFTKTDLGEYGNPTTNACGDNHPGDVRGAGSAVPPVRVTQNEGGAMRSQDFRTSSGPVGLNGTIIRVDPATGAGAAGNPAFGSADPNRKRIVAFGLRNPFRFTFRPGTNEIWTGDVGPDEWEEINRVENPLSGPVNFGWPCAEGPQTPSPSFPAYNATPLCGLGATATPYYWYRHGIAQGPIPNDNILGTDPCPEPRSDGLPGGGGSSITAVAFAPSDGSGPYPPAYRGALFFADWARNCAWAMKAGTNGLPDPSRIEHFVRGAGIVQLAIGPPGTPYAGDLFYVNIGKFDGDGGALPNSGEIRRVHFGAAIPKAVLTTNTVAGPAPLAVTFDASRSTNPGPGALTYGWDFDGNGTYGDATGVTVTHLFPPGHHSAGVRVTNSGGISDFAAVEIDSGAPTINIDTPTTALKWVVGQTVPFAGSAADAEEGVLPATSLKWALNLRHCEPGNADACHNHGPLSSETGTSGSFVTPDHGFPSYLVLTASATDASGARATKSLRLDPKAVNWVVDTKPSGGVLSVGSTTAAGPLKLPVVANSGNEVTVASPQAFDGVTRSFVGWSDRGAASHTAKAPGDDGSLIATFTNGLPVAKLSTDRTNGTPPFRVNFDASASTDPDAPAGDTVRFAWDLDGDGSFDDGANAKIAKTYVSAGSTKVRVRVTDRAGESNIAAVAIGGVALSPKQLNSNPCRRNTFVARYFTGTKPGKVVPFLTRCEKAVNARWGTRRPVKGAPADNFSVRWAGRFTFSGSNVRFRAIADDGIRVWVDGKLIINRWTRKNRLATIDRYMSRGTHGIRVEYVERRGAAKALVTWARRG